MTSPNDVHSVISRPFGTKLSRVNAWLLSCNVTLFQILSVFSTKIRQVSTVVKEKPLKLQSGVLIA